jgi:hypothetical protein
MNRYRFTAYAAGATREMNPIGFIKSAKIKKEREGENIFFRKRLSGSPTFVDDDFEWLHNLEEGGRRCEEVGYKIEMECGGEYREIWNGYYSLTDAKVDLKACRMILNSPQPGDLYKCLMDGYGKEYNVLSVPASTAYSVQAKLDFDADFQFQRVEMGKFTEELVDDFDTWASFLETSYWIDGTVFKPGTRSKTQIIFRMVKEEPYANGEIVDLSGENWKVIQDNIQRNGRLYAKYAKQPDLYNFKPYKYGTTKDFTKYADLKQIGCNDTFDQDRYIEITGPGGAFNEETKPNLNLRTNVNATRCVRLIWEFGTFTFNRNRRLVDVLKYLVEQSCPAAAPTDADEISEFLTAEENYATGTINVLKDLLIVAKSDIIGYNSSEPASKALISLKNLLDDLRQMLQLYWYLDAEGKFRIEHFSFFDQVGIVDLNQEKYARWMNRAYEYDKPNMPRYERLIFSEYFNEDFHLGEIEYSGACVNKLEGQDTKEYNITRFDNDLQNLIIQGESLNRQGFVLIAHQEGQVLKEDGPYSGEELVNGHLAAANLIKHYHQHGRVLGSGLVNGLDTVFKSTLRIKKQNPIIIEDCCEPELDPFATFATGLSSNGSLLYTELSLQTGALAVATLHPAEDGDLFNPARSFDDSFSDSFR